MVSLRWLLVIVLWTALDLAGPVLVVPVEAGQEASEEAVGGVRVRRRLPAGLVSARPAADLPAGREVAAPHVIAAVTALRAGPPPVTVRKLPSAGLDPGDAPDESH